jgi:hypothetical protein
VVLVFEAFVGFFKMVERFGGLKGIFGHEGNFLVQLFVFGFGLFEFFFGVVFIALKEPDFFQFKEELLILLLQELSLLF